MTLMRMLYGERAEHIVMNVGFVKDEHHVHGGSELIRFGHVNV